ncbi:hypothetical protein RRG08_023062 [Elysia crispata]|uniref:Uncharacterized protein n=1 Tax=Elysia crispata TaxID=231223 RepID=A0AAE1E4R0_9GAST|nr:hypothetical protein RRG08_023062 [Elysia crispata]
MHPAATRLFSTFDSKRSEGNPPVLCRKHARIAQPAELLDQQQTGGQPAANTSAAFRQAWGRMHYGKECSHSLHLYLAKKKKRLQMIIV